MIANKLFIVTVFSFLSITACKNSTYPHKLLQADSLTATRSDSAIVILEKMKKEMTSAPSKTQMYYHLLCIKAHDKAYHPHQSNSLIDEVLNYYVEEDDRQHLPEAYYYAGRVYRDLGDAPQALDYFGKALTLLSDDREQPLKSKIYSQMGTLFLYQDIYDEALNIFKKAYQYNILRKDSVDMVYNLRDMADAYRGNNELDSALCYYQKSADLAYELNDSCLIRTTQSQLASLFVQLKKYEQAKIALRMSMRTKNKFDQSAVYSIASKLYHQTGRIDSAIYYYKKLLDCGTIYAKKNASWGLSQISMDRGDTHDAYFYLKQYMIHEDSVSKITNAEATRKMNSLYNYQLRENESKQLKADNDKKSLTIIAILIISVFLVVTAIIYILYSRVKSLRLAMQLKEMERLKKEQYWKSLQFIEENNKKMGELEKKLRDANNTNEALRKQLEQQQEEIICANKRAKIAILEIANKRTDFSKSEIGILLNNRVTLKEYKLSKDEWGALEKKINEIYDNFTVKLNAIYRMNRSEQQVCLLLKANLSPTAIAGFINLSKSAISQTRSRLYEKFFKESGNGEMWDEFIRSL